MQMVCVRPKAWPWWVASCLLALWPAATALSAPLTPESPEIRAAIERGTKWLETTADPRWGSKPLVGLVMVKKGAPAEHPRIVEAVETLRKFTTGTNDPNEIIRRIKDDQLVYGVSIGVIFLISLDASQYREEIEKFLKVLAVLQKQQGGWGYPTTHDLFGKTSDTSMTQYAVLAMWEAHQSGFEVPVPVIDRVLEWLLCSQDPSGAFGYQGNVASSPTALVAQTEVRHSMVAAGLGSVYVGADLLGLASRTGEKENLPPALKAVQKKGPVTASRNDRRAIEAAKKRGNGWMKENYKIEVPFACHYYLYALERYWSLRELAEGVSAEDPPWYTDGATYLLQNQKADGSWIGQYGYGGTGPSVPDTCFSLLFLLRSMKKSIEADRSYGRGLMVGGRGLPKGAAAVQLRGGQVVSQPLAGPGQGLMTALQNVDSDDYDQAVDALADLPADAARQLVSQNAAKLREMVDGDSSDARLAAVQALAKSDNLDAVPTLIYALSDPDPSVVLAADDGLQRMSRRFHEVGLPENFTDAQRTEAIRQWKDWYLAIRPDAEFDN
jgi:hypothetical protein